MDTVIRELQASPKLELYFEEIQRILQAEQIKRSEFYRIITPKDKAEFINGEIIFHSPVRLRHNRVGKLLLVLIDAYVRKHQLGYVGYEKLLISLTRNDYEPDICFFRRDVSQTFSPQQMRFPAPDFIVEILSDTTLKIDREIKFDDYAAHGVKEYWIIDPDAEIVEQYLLQDEEYMLLKKTDSGILKSEAIPGFTIPVRAMFDEQENLNALQALIGEEDGPENDHLSTE